MVSGLSPTATLPLHEDWVGVLHLLREDLCPQPSLCLWALCPFLVLGENPGHVAHRLPRPGIPHTPGEVLGTDRSTNKVDYGPQWACPTRGPLSPHPENPNTDFTEEISNNLFRNQ